MSEQQLKTPVVLIVFNRPDTTEKVFAEVARAKPDKLLVIADGPRLDQPGEAEKCAATRAIIERVDWDCEVLTNYVDTNMGCKRRVASGLDWVFGQVDEAIILEDDCVPHHSFFGFCEELLERYQNDTRVMMIAGTNYQIKSRQVPYSYFFSRFFPIWGWATWRRAWKTYDIDISAWRKSIRLEELREVAPTRLAARYYANAFDLVSQDRINTWDYQWSFGCLFNNGLAVVPAVNLVENIGTTGTHADGVGKTHFMERGEITKSLTHPTYVYPEPNYDRFIFSSVIRPVDVAMGGAIAHLRTKPWLRWAYSLFRGGYRLTKGLLKVFSKN